MTLSTGQIFVSRYRVVNKLHQGGMGAIYRAWDLHLNKHVALKENLEIGLEARQQFNREATILGNLSHPNLPRVTEHFFLENQGQYLVMDFIEGEDLESMVDRLGPLPEDTAVGWFLQISSALDYLHRQPSPIIHRDIKPANIKITPEGRAVLVDFGIAKFYEHDRTTMDGAKAVTPGFSPLEQYHASTDARSDIYSLGASLYTVVTGELLPESTRLVLGEARLIPPRQLQPGLSPALEAVILKAVKIHPEHRYQSAAELLAALKTVFQAPTAAVTTLNQQFPTQVLADQPQVITPPTGAAGYAPGQGVKPDRRTMMIALLVVGIAVLCGIGILSAILFRNRSTGIANQSTESGISQTAGTAQTVSQTNSSPLPSSTSLGFLPPPPTSVSTQVPVLLTSTPTDTLLDTLAPALLTLDQNFNCRGGTSTDYDIIRTLELGTQLKIIGKSEDQWWLVRLDDPSTRRKQCWVHGGIASGDLESVPYSDWTGTVETARTPWP